MLDIKLIRENPEAVREALLKRMAEVSFDELLAWDADCRAKKSEADGLKARRNTVSASIPQLKKQGEDIEALTLEMRAIGGEIKALDDAIGALETKIFDFLAGLPNLPDEDVVPGGKENNEVLHHWGEKPDFPFEALDHVTLCERLGLIDYKRGVKLSGNGFWIYRGWGARLEWALVNFFIAQHLADGYEMLMVPYILDYQCGLTAGQFPKFEEDVYWVDNPPVDRTGKFLLPTAETALVSVHRDEILSEADLPLKYCAYSQCFRREAGSARTEERGMIRGHQFNKVEMVHYAHPDHSRASFDEMVGKAERIVQQLGLHYRLSKLAAGDCSASMARTYDIEVWLPSMGIYKEVSSASNGGDYQARRGNMRFRDAEGKIRFLHTLNASGLATSRLIPAIVEQFQQGDGSVVVPEVLRPYLGIDVLKP